MSAAGVPAAPEEKPLLVSFLVCLFYGATSGSLAMIMKSLLSGFKFEGYFLLLAAQYGLQLAICVFTRDHMRGNPLSVPTYDRAVHMRSLWMGVLGVVNVGAGLVALRMVNVPMFLCIRRLVSSFILGYEFAVLGRVPTTGVLLAVCGILVGTLLAGWETLSANAVGYAVTLLNNVLSAAFSVVMKQFSDAHKQTGEGSAIGTLYYNCLTVFPLALLLAAAAGEVDYVRHFRAAGDPGFLLSFSLVVAMGPLITYSTTLCTTYNSPLATSITGNVKDIVVTITGALLFPGFIATASTVSGLTLSFAGALGYAANSVRAAQGAGAAKASAAASATADEEKGKLLGTDAAATAHAG